MLTRLGIDGRKIFGNRFRGLTLRLSIHPSLWAIPVLTVGSADLIFSIIDRDGNHTSITKVVHCITTVSHCYFIADKFRYRYYFSLVGLVPGMNDLITHYACQSSHVLISSLSNPFPWVEYPLASSINFNRGVVRLPARLPNALGTVSSAFALSKITHEIQAGANGPFSAHKPWSSSYSCPGRRQSCSVRRTDGTKYNSFSWQWH